MLIYSCQYPILESAERDIGDLEMYKSILAIVFTILLLGAASSFVIIPQSYTATAADSNGRIVFASDRDGNYEIYSMNPDGTNETLLTRNAANDTNPSWSPDSKKIAFVRDHDIYVMNVDGKNLVKLTEGLAIDSDPTWSPDRKEIAFVSNRDGDYDVYVMDADGTDEVNLTDDDDDIDDLHPSWSPDGKKIAFTRSDEVFVMDSDGTDKIRLTSGSHPDWSPDGTKIVFASKMNGSDYEIYLMDTDGTDVVRLTQNSFEDIEPDYGPLSQYVPDETPPVVTVTPERAPDMNGYYTRTVRFTIQGDDTTTGDSGIRSCDPTLTHTVFDGNDIEMTASCTDNAGNVGYGSAVISYDDSSPDVSIIIPKESADIQNNNNPFTITGNAIDDVSGIEKVEVSIDSGPYRTATLSSNTWSFAAGELSAGISHTIKAKATDRAGNSRTVEVEFTVSANQSPSEPSFNIMRRQVELPTGDIVDLDIRSTSRLLQEFNLDVENKKVSLTIQEDGESDTTTVIPISRIFDGPYVVMINGQIIADFEILEDKEAGETSVQFQHPSGTSEIEIIGTRVVPEFTSASIVTSALLVSIIIVVVLAGIWGRLKKDII